MNGESSLMNGPLLLLIYLWYFSNVICLKNKSEQISSLTDLINIKKHPDQMKL